MREVLLYAPFLLVPFAVQMAVLFATEHRFQPLRFAEPILIGAAIVLIPLLCCLTAPKGLGILVLPLVIIICLALAGLAAIGWGFAWLVYYLIRRSVQFQVALVDPAHPAEPDPERPAQRRREHE